MAFYDIQDFKTVRIQVVKSIKLTKSQKKKNGAWLYLRS